MQQYIIDLCCAIQSSSILLRDNEISPFFINRQCGIAGDGNAVGVESVFLLNIDGVYGEWKSKDPIGES